MWNCNWNTPIWHYGGPFGILVTVLVAVILVSMIAVFLRLVFARRTSGRDREDSMQILRNRLVQGEISEEEYHRTKDILGG